MVNFNRKLTERIVMRRLNQIAAIACFCLLFVTGLGWLLDEFKFWGRNTRFQRWLTHYF